MSNRFEDYVMLIRKSAHHYSKLWNIEYDEIESQGYLIYCNCLKSWNSSKSSFSTHLTWELKRLNDYCRTYKRQMGYLIEDYFNKPKVSESDDNYDDCEFSHPDSYVDYFNRESGLSLEELLNIGLENLSSEAYEIFRWILERRWEKKGRQKPSISLAMSEFNYTRSKVEDIWKEIKKFYKNYSFNSYKI